MGKSSFRRIIRRCKTIVHAVYCVEEGEVCVYLPSSAHSSKKITLSRALVITDAVQIGN
jgi:hypothetical protein